MYHKPLSAADLVPISAANFPSLAHCFLFDDLPDVAAFGATTACSVSNLVLNASGTASLRADGTANITTALTTISAGSVVSPGSRSVVGYHIGYPAAGVASAANVLGDIVANTNYGIRMAGGGADHRLAVGNGTSFYESPSDASTALNGDGTTFQLHMMIAEWDTAAGLRGYDHDGATWNSRASTDLTGVTGIVTLDTGIRVPVTSNPAMILWFYFDDLPSDEFLKAAGAWMFDKFVHDGVKAIYPPLAGR